MLLTGAVGLIALRLDVATSTSFINFGAFTAFTCVNLAVIATYARGRRAGRRPRPLPWVLAPAVGAAVDIWLPAHLDGRAVTLGLIRLGLGVVCLACLTRLFREPPPARDFTEDAPVTTAG